MTIHTVLICTPMHFHCSCIVTQFLAAVKCKDFKNDNGTARIK